MRMPFPLVHLFNSDAHSAPARLPERASEVPLAEMEDSVPSMNLWSGAMMLLAIGFSHQRLSAHQRAGGRAKRAIPRSDA
jgi:hypothetical protein